MTFANFFVPGLKTNTLLTSALKTPWLIAQQIDTQNDIQAIFCTAGHIKVHLHSTSLSKHTTKKEENSWWQEENHRYQEKFKKKKSYTPTVTGLEPAIPRSEVWCLIH